LGGLLGLLAGSHFPIEYKSLAQSAIGLGTLAMGVKMFLATRNLLIPLGSLIAGGLLGHALGIQAGMDTLGAWARDALGGGSTFQEAFVTTSLLYCVGPMTLLGCLEEGLEGKVHLLSVKSILDGVSSAFFAAALGAGALLSAGTVLVVQAPLTLGARRLRFLEERRAILDETSASGGLMLMAIGLGLMEIKRLPTADFLPALLLAAIAAALLEKGQSA
jgi:uncharacterized membrane protein YqgA involved in biofilm formation